ncbi:hypothetical protein B9Z19DRAFT_1104880 [Tuber borchii]|uniref:Uncharacterized protein n=1 Tax=Tuber borchii TaxID=42251 RepID=A0A2T7A849_TUBBO|nr:hypothetical protein B9Z19DRAFT_1104880 [Tuber borchii]
MNSHAGESHKRIDMGTVLVPYWKLGTSALVSPMDWGGLPPAKRQENKQIPLSIPDSLSPTPAIQFPHDVGPHDIVVHASDRLASPDPKICYLSPVGSGWFHESRDRFSTAKYNIKLPHDLPADRPLLSPRGTGSSVEIKTLRAQKKIKRKNAKSCRARIYASAIGYGLGYATIIFRTFFQPV